MHTRHLQYDGSFDGFLTAVFTVFDEKIEDAHIQLQGRGDQLLFAQAETVITDETKANRVWNGLQKYIGFKESKELYYAFLSEKQEVEHLLLTYIKYVFMEQQNVGKDYAHPSVLKIVQIARKVAREKHRMEAFIRFKLTKDGIYFANIVPDFNVLPLIKKHFTTRYADQKWLIYDIKRKYGLFYDLEKTEIIHLELPKNFDFSATKTDFFAEEELEFESLWQNYFTSTNIKSRKNMKLHTQHVPKRYWKYLSEKWV